jgi:tetratricopeptide (TPR) repeat protein
MNSENRSGPGNFAVPSLDSNLEAGNPFLNWPQELQQASSLWAAKRINESLRFYDKAARLYPEDSVVLIEAAKAFGNQMEMARSEGLLTKLRQKFASDPKILHETGKCFRAIGCLDEAVDCFQTLLELSADSFEAHLELSRIFERINQLEQGLHHAAKCLSLRPNSSEAILVQSQLLRRIGDVTQAEADLRALGSNADVSPEVRASSLYQLGYLLDDACRFDEAFESVSTAKEIQLSGSRELTLESTRQIAILEDVWTTVVKSDYERWERETAALPREKIAFLIGAPRSGTTLLERVLGSHTKISSTDEELFLPQVVLPEVMNNRDHRMLHLSDLNQLTTGRLKIERDRYFRYLSSVLRGNSREKLHIDKNPSLIRLLPAILRLFPEAKLLFALRDPRDIVVSCFMRQFPLNPISVEFLTLEGAAISVARDLQLWQRLKQQLPNQWLEVRYEDMITDLESSSKATLEFLGVNWDPAVLNFHRSTAPVTSPTYEAVAKPIYQSASGRWKNYESQLQPVLPILQPVIETWGY